MAIVTKNELIKVLETCPEGNHPYGIRIQKWFPKWEQFATVELQVQNPHEAMKDSETLDHLIEELEGMFKVLGEQGPRFGPAEWDEGGVIH